MNPTTLLRLMLLPSAGLAACTCRFYPATQNHLGLDADGICVQGPLCGGVPLAVGTVCTHACDAKPEACTAPAITMGPMAPIACSGRPAAFNVVVSGGPSLACHSLRDDQPIPCASASSHTIAAVGPGDAGARLPVRVSTGKGAVTSGSAALTCRSQVDRAELRINGPAAPRRSMPPGRRA